MSVSRARIVIEPRQVADRVRAVLDVADLEACEPDTPGPTQLAIVTHDRLASVAAEGASGRPVIVLCAGTGRRAAIELITEHRLRYLVPVDDHLEDALLTTIGKLAGAPLFGLDRHVRHGGLVQTWQLADSRAKTGVLHAIGERARRLGCPHLIADIFLSAIDEMAINAVARHARAGLGPIEIAAAAEVGRFAVAVRDSLGELRPEHVADALTRGGAQKTGGVALDATSARLGFRIMLDTLSTLAIHVEPGRRTELIGVIDLGKSLREYRDTVPCYGCFVTAGAV